jgi:hypothetical protein
MISAIGEHNIRSSLNEDLNLKVLYYVQLLRYFPVSVRWSYSVLVSSPVVKLLNKHKLIQCYEWITSLGLDTYTEHINLVAVFDLHSVGIGFELRPQTRRWSWRFLGFLRCIDANAMLLLKN